ncbi:MAG: ribonuclease HII [Candidatus Nomurabacteria bacterium]|jgi:ribonuclease HII|nr:ribonuclease HII [Candidatus Nomurabacteria bacterium]
MILGIDEVGRGAWAGPLAVGAVILDAENTPDGLRDSKKLSPKRRRELTLQIKQSALGIGVGWVSAPQLDKIGMSATLKLAARRAACQIAPEILAKVDQIIIDGTLKMLDDPRATTLIKADDRVKAVSAASIVAKVSRDAYMARLDEVFTDEAGQPLYDFARHVGYGTAAHRAAIEKFGVLPGVHRVSFRPIVEILNSQAPADLDFSGHFYLRAKGSEATRDDGLTESPLESRLGRRGQSLKKVDSTIGRIAENIAAEWLAQNRGHTILARNWRTKFCEIDIISRKAETIYFTEVKYRRNDIAGGGLAAIDRKKRRQIEFAAEIWESKNHSGADLKLSAIALTGRPPRVVDYVENIAAY